MSCRNFCDTGERKSHVAAVVPGHGLCLRLSCEAEATGDWTTVYVGPATMWEVREAAEAAEAFHGTRGTRVLLVNLPISP